MSDINAKARSLSGCNRQRLVVARELSKGAKNIVASNPTRGLDISLTIYVRSLLKELRNKGVSILQVSSDIDEVMELGDRSLSYYVQWKNNRDCLWSSLTNPSRGSIPVPGVLLKLKIKIKSKYSE